MYICSLESIDLSSNKYRPIFNFFKYKYGPHEKYR